MHQKSIDMTSGGLFKKILSFAFPLMLTGILQIFFTAADQWVVSKFDGETALAAVGTTSSLINIILNFAVGFSIGASVVTAIYIGAKDSQNVRITVSSSIFLAVICGIICMLVGFIFAPVFLRWIATPHDVIDQAIIYLRMYFLGAPALVVYNFSASVLRASGETRKPLLYLSFAGIFNVFLNLVFVIYFKMGVAGVGLATSLSNYLSMVLVLRDLVKTDEMYKLTGIKPDLNILKKIIIIGVPSGIQSMLFSFSNMIIQSTVNTFGSAVVAGRAASNNLQNVLYLITNSFANTATTIVGQNFGARKYKRINKAYIECVLICTVVGLLSGLILLLFSDPYLMFFLPEGGKAVIYAKRELYIMLPTYFLCGVMEIGAGVLRSLGKATSTMIVTIFGVCGMRILWIYTVFAHFQTYESIFYSYIVSWILTFLVHLTIYLLIKDKIKAKCFEEGQVI